MAAVHKIVVLDPLAQEGLDLLAATAGMEFEVRTGLKGPELRTTLAAFDGAILRSGVKITADALEGNRRLKAIVRAGVGTDNIDRTAATRLGIVVMNTPTGNTLSTAEHAVAMMMALSRNIAPAYQSLIEGRWDRSKYMGTQLADKTLGIVGLGRIGQAVARIAKALQMRLVGYDPFLSQDRAQELGVELVANVRDMLPRVDYLTVHTPLTNETRDLIGEPELDILKPGVRLVNCARGGIYNEAALVKGLQSGRLAGVALDVYAEEPCKSSPLFGMPGVVCTPHLGASTEEAQTQVAVEGAQLLIDFFTTGAIRHAVNMAAIDPKTLAGLKGFLNLAHRLGLLMAQWAKTGIQSCSLRYRGEVAAKETQLLTSAFAAGLLEEACEDVNIVNAEVLLKERGIELKSERTTDVGAFSSSMAVQISADGRTYAAAGTLFGNVMPRLVRLGEHRLETYLDGTLLLFEHRDVPGIIGAIGTIFGRHNVNIAQMSVGRATDQPGGEAVGALNLDSQPPDEALEEVRAHPAIKTVTVIKLPPAGKLPDWLGG
ncbi:MAG: phosphoglycerate dehydrogenase [Pirellulales bacterium]